MTVAYQLYCSRNWPLAETLAMLKDVGFTAVEGYGGLFDAPEPLKDDLARHGLSMPSGHFGLDMVEGETTRTIEVAQSLGVTKVFVPFVAPADRPSDREGWQGFARRLAEAGKPIRDAGLTYGWHNHDFELADVGGVTPLELIAEAGVDLELDLGWVKRAGADPADWIGRFSDRIAAVHVKDLASEGGNLDEDGWADVGRGVQDWPAIKAALETAGIDHLVIEHDNPKDHRRFASNSLAAVKDW